MSYSGLVSSEYSSGNRIQRRHYENRECPFCAG